VGWGVGGVGLGVGCAPHTPHPPTPQPPIPNPQSPKYSKNFFKIIKI